MVRPETVELALASVEPVLPEPPGLVELPPQAPFESAAMARAAADRQLCVQKARRDGSGSVAEGVVTSGLQG